MKKELRALLRQKRRQLSTTLQEQAAKSVMQTVLQLPLYQKSQSIAYYLSDEGELNPQPLIEHAEQQNKCSYLPVIKDPDTKELTFFSYRCNDTLVENQFAILEPNPRTQRAIDPIDLDLVIVPLVAFDEDCHRMGRGAGYYDRCFAFLDHNATTRKPVLIGLAYEFQKVDALPVEKWDIALEHVITERKIYSRKG